MPSTLTLKTEKGLEEEVFMSKMHYFLSTKASSGLFLQARRKMEIKLSSLYFIFTSTF
jgi:hypothetical protein